MHQQKDEDQHVRVAEAVRAACLAAAQESYEEASMRGLCHEGAWECALGVVRILDGTVRLTKAVLVQFQSRRQTRMCYNLAQVASTASHICGVRA